MTRYLFLAFVLAVGLAVFRMSTVAAQVAEIKTSLPSVSQASPASGPVSAIGATSAFTTYLPSILKPVPQPCTVSPTLTSPANGSNLNTLIPVFEVNGVYDPAATRLIMQVAKDTGFTQIVSSYSTSLILGPREFQFPWNLDPATTHYWRAYLLCGSSPSPYSAVWSFITGSGGTMLPAPALIAPPNGSSVPSTSATLQWAAVNGATQYLVEWRRLGSGGFYFERVTGTQMTLTGLSPSGTYQWWVAAQNDYAVGSASATWQFTTPAASSSNSLEHAIHAFAVHDDMTTAVEEQDSN